MPKLLRVTLLALVFIAAVSGAGIYYASHSRISLGSKVLVVPVQTQISHEGVKGLLTIQMTRQQVRDNLGPPLKASHVDFMAGTGPEFVGKVFAWVRYNSKNEVLNFRFDLSKILGDYIGELQVLLFRDGKRYLLKRGMSLSEVEKLFDGKGAEDMAKLNQRQEPEKIILRIHDEPDSGELRIRGTGTVLGFDKEGLCSVSVTSTVME